MDIRLHNMGVDPHQYRNALRETNERNRVYLQKFWCVWYGVCLVSLLFIVLFILATAGIFRVEPAWIVMVTVQLPFIICCGFKGWRKCAGSQYRAKLVREVWDLVMQSHGVGVEMWADQKFTGPVIGFGVTAVTQAAGA